MCFTPSLRRRTPGRYALQHARHAAPMVSGGRNITLLVAFATRRPSLDASRQVARGMRAKLARDFQNFSGAYSPPSRVSITEHFDLLLRSKLE